MRRKLSIVVTLATVFLFFYFISVVHSFIYRPIVAADVNTSIKIYPNQSSSALIERLREKNIFQNMYLFSFLIHVMVVRHPLRFGEYQIQYPVTGWQLLRHMMTGTGLVQHRLTIVNGWTFHNIKEAIFRDNNFSPASLLTSNADMMKKLNIADSNPEGLFYPDTYFFTWGNSEMVVLKAAYQKMQTILQNAWNTRAPNLPYQNVYQALIVASLIERETSLDLEKPFIASVILNRLKKNMRLQIDPTILYGLKKSYGDTITQKDLQSKTSYNTYQIAGLPPTPICMPSQSSIEAALHPATTDYLYYVATGKGGHQFSKTFAGHEKQVAKYRNVVESGR